MAKPDNAQSFMSGNAVIIAAASLLAIVMGAFSVLFAGLAGNHYGLLLALPGALILGLFFVFARYTLFFLIILFRSVMDQILDTTKFGSFGLGAVINGLVILIALIAIFERPNPVRKILKDTWLPFLLVIFATLLIAPELVPAIKATLTLLSYAAVFALAIVVIRSEEDYGRWMRAVFLSSLLPVAYGFVDAATGGFVSENGFRIRSTFTHPNVFAFYLLLMISLGFYFWKSKVTYISPFFRSVIPLYILLMVGFLLFTKTRSAWIACFAFFILYGLIFERKYLLLILIAPIVAMLIPEIRDRILDLTQGNEVINYSKLNSYAWRKLIWESALRWMEPSHYLFGYGTNAFMHYSVDFFDMSGGKQTGAHNVYVQLIFDAGAIGLLTFLWLFGSVGYHLGQFYKQNKLMIFSAIMLLGQYVMIAYSDNMLGYLAFNWYFWFVIGAAYSVSYHKKVSAESEIADITQA